MIEFLEKIKDFNVCSTSGSGREDLVKLAKDNGAPHAEYWIREYVSEEAASLLNWQLLNGDEAWLPNLIDKIPNRMITSIAHAIYIIAVPHRPLLDKLHSYGIDPNLICWISSYLTDRQQHVVCEGVSSSNIHVLSGVPQGSVLGPLLFIIYINDLPSCISYTEMFLFADDAKVLKEISNSGDSEFLQQDLYSIQSWCKKWELHPNTKMCVSVRFSLTTSKQDEFVYKVYGSAIQSSPSHKDL